MNKDTIKELLEHPEFTLGEPDDKAIERQVKPGEYFATKIYRKGIDEYAFAYINIDDWITNITKISMLL